MSYSIEIIDKNTEEIVEIESKFDICGASYIIGGTTSLEFNITFNYATKINSALEGGIKGLNDKEVLVVVNELAKAICKIPYESPSDNYWEDTWGNARFALIDLLNLCLLAPPDARMKIYC